MTASFLNGFFVSNTCISALGKRQKRSLLSYFPVVGINFTKQVSIKFNLERKFNFDTNRDLFFY